MKKIYLILLVIILSSAPSISYFIAKEKAEEIWETQQENISPLKGELILFFGKNFSPRWLFSGEYNELMTGSTFDIYISLTGKVLKVPKGLKKNNLGEFRGNNID